MNDNGKKVMLGSTKSIETIVTLRQTNWRTKIRVYTLRKVVLTLSLPITLKFHSDQLQIFLLLIVKTFCENFSNSAESLNYIIT